MTTHGALVPLLLPGNSYMSREHALKASIPVLNSMLFLFSWLCKIDVSCVICYDWTEIYGYIIFWGV